jgi:aryl carrier-like protein
LEHRKTLKINSETRAFQFAAYTFIVNTFELFTPLIEGGCVCVPSKEDRLGRTAGAMRDLGANWATFTPSFLRSIKPEDVPNAKTITLAGEPVQEDNLKTWGPRVNLVNMYGSSECSVCVTGDFSGRTGRSTIGRAVGTVAWIADVADHNRLAPVGSIGELLVEGPTLAREYIHLPDKTADAFIENPPWLRDIRKGAPSRVYKTGDLVRYGSDGRLNLVGRKDMQVKLRGQRIEIEEVEFHLRQAMPRGIEAAVGLVRPVEQPDKPFLAAFVALKKAFGDDFHTVDPESTETLESLAGDWQSKLSGSLPGYMVPSALVKLGYMPLTASGKLNRKSLSEFASQLTMTSLAGSSNKEHMEPATETGMILRKLWAEALQTGESRISADDSFLHLGGNSIDAMHLVNLARREGLGLSVGDIFSHPELDDMAGACSTLSSETTEDAPFSLIDNREDVDLLCEAASAQCQVRKSAIEDLYPCTAMQEGLMALSDAREGVYMAQHTLALGSGIDLQRFKHACHQVVAANPILRTRIAYPEQSAALQVILRPGIDWRAGDSLESYLKEDKKNSMKAGKALTRYAIVPDAGGWTFVWTVHHAVYDAWTMDLVFDRIDKAYKQQPVDESTPFKEFMKYVAKTDRDLSTKFWQEYLAGATQNEFPSVVSTGKQPVADATVKHEMSVSRNDKLTGITMPSLIRAA